MDKFAQHIDKLIQKVLNEAAEEKATEVSEKLHGGQKNLDKRSDVAEGLPAAFGVGGKPCPIQPTQTIMKANDESMEFRGRTIE